MTNIPIGSLDPTLIINCWDEQFQDLIMKTVQELNEFMEMLDIPEKILVNFDTTNYDYPNVKRMFLKFQDSAFMIESSKPKARNLPQMLIKALNNAVLQPDLNMTTFDVVFGK
mgnify:FL=1